MDRATAGATGPPGHRATGPPFACSLCIPHGTVDTDRRAEMPERQPDAGAHVHEAGRLPASVPGERDHEEICSESPWIPAFAGMTVRSDSRIGVDAHGPVPAHPEGMKVVWGLSWECGHLARMNNRVPPARCGRDARAPRKRHLPALSRQTSFPRSLSPRWRGAGIHAARSEHGCGVPDATPGKTLQAMYTTGLCSRSRCQMERFHQCLTDRTFRARHAMAQRRICCRSR